MSDQRSRVCPHLGLIHDTATHMGFPASENRCFHSRPPKSPDLSYQQSFCLQKSYDTCGFYQNDGARPTALEVTAPSVSGKRSKTIFLFLVLLIVAGAALIGVGEWKGLPGSVFVAPPQPQVEIPLSGTVTASAEAVSLSTNTPTHLWISGDTSTPQPADTVTPLPHLHGFEITKMPAGTDQGYLIHIVAPGETLDMIAVDYNTTVQAIIAVNYKLKPPVWVQYPIVIPVGTKDARGLPAFDVYVVEAYETIKAESLADVLGVDAAALEFYNLCTGNCQFNKGDVLLVPYTQ